MKKQSNKDEYIKIFMEHQTELGMQKIYIHPVNAFLYAHVRQLSAAERNANAALEDGSELQFTVNRRVISSDAFIEWRGNVYQITAIDNYEFKAEQDLRIRARVVRTAASYISTSGTGWSS